MALEYRNGRKYYYRKKRIGRKVKSEYIGSGEFASSLFILDKYELNEKKAQKELNNNERQLQAGLDKEISELENTLNEILTGIAINNGYHKHKRQWRKKRHI